MHTNARLQAHAHSCEFMHTHHGRPSDRTAYRVAVYIFHGLSFNGETQMDCETVKRLIWYWQSHIQEHNLSVSLFSVILTHT